MQREQCRQVVLAHLSEPFTNCDHSSVTSSNPVGLTCPNTVEDSDIYLLWTGGLHAPSSPIPAVGVGGLLPCIIITSSSRLVPLTEGPALDGLVPLAEGTFF